jgi:signal transduction histidine kinase
VRLWNFCRRRYDILVAVVLTVGAAVALMAQGQLVELPGSVCVLGFCALIALRRRWPVLVAIAAGLLIAIPEFAGDAATVNANVAFISQWAAVFLFCYALGADARFPLSLVGVVAILVGVNISAGGWNPVPEMLALGPYAGGLSVASRRRASGELEVRAHELEEEREIFAVQSVRYERARIARELHDIVAHNVSLIVVQANAGERIANVDPESAAEAFASISEAARQAAEEIDQLIELLHDPAPPPPSAGLRIVEELVARARASGLVISCRLRGDIDDVSQGSAEVAYRVVQEGITNAVKHAPGAAVDIDVRGERGGVEIRVTNGPARTRPTGLEAAGGGNGLSGMRARVAQCNGTCIADPTPDGGWQLVAHLPRRAAASRAAVRGGF